MKDKFTILNKKGRSIGEVEAKDFYEAEDIAKKLVGEEYGYLRKKIEREEGICPKCGSIINNYGEDERDESGIAFSYTCDKCKFKGVEWHSLVFSEHRDVETGEVI